MISITVSPAKTVTIQPAVTKEVTLLNVDSITDRPSVKQVSVVVREIGNVILWEGDSYDAIGQWTHSDVEDRIKELFSI